jgi:hypothetical protein
MAPQNPLFGGNLREFITHALGESTTDEFERITNAFRVTCIFPGAAPKHVYHYTDLNGLIGILEKQELWATDITYMNDTSEYHYANSVIEGVVDDLLRTCPSLRQMREALCAAFPLKAYAACFCTKENLLSQWRAYSTPGGGTGYAIEFEWSVDEINRDSADAVAGRIEYEEPNQIGLFQHLSECLLPSFADGSAEGAIGAVTGRTAKEVMDAITKPIIQPLKSWLIAGSLARCFIKSSVFAEESEWRIINVEDRNDTSERFRPRGGLLVPYLPIDLRKPTMPRIKRVFTGPGPHPAKARESIERFLRKLELREIKVEASTVPLRL